VSIASEEERGVIAREVKEGDGLGRKRQRQRVVSDSD
jgi:hypothetical protein